jgi:hypothetical protein
MLFKSSSHFVEHRKYMGTGVTKQLNEDWDNIRVWKASLTLTICVEKC